MATNSLSRTWFLGHGCKQVPPEFIDGRVLWSDGKRRFLNAYGRVMPHTLSPSNQTSGKHCHNGKRGNDYPCMRHFGSKSCHLLVALAFYGPRPTFIGKTGKPYVGICHHLVPDVLDYSAANLLCWLTREQHSEADRRQRALREVVPDGDLTLFTYERLRDLQDPRSMSRELFEQELAAIRSQHFSRSPLSTDALMLHDMTHHMEV